MAMRVAVLSLLYACRCTPRRTPLRRRWQIGLVRLRYKRTWTAASIRKLVEKYGAQEDRC